MAERERRFQLGIANPTVEISVQVATANARRFDPDQDVTRPSHPGGKHLLNTEVARAMESGGVHPQSAGRLTHRLRPGSFR